MKKNRDITTILVFSLTGVGMLIFFSLKIMKAAETGNWHSTKGEIYYSGVKESVSQGRLIRSTLISYRYSVYGQNYDGKKITYKMLKLEPSLRSVNLLDKYKKGEIVTVYYNPESPSQAVLIPGYSMWDFLAIIFGLIFAVVLPFLYFKYNKGSNAKSGKVTNML